MKVFEITALTETFDVKKGVLDKDGKPMWNVIDKETGNVVKRYTGGGAEEDAVRDMDNRNAKIKDQEKSKKSTAQQTDQKEPVQKRSKNPVRNEPRLTDEPRTPKTTPPDSTNSKLRALHPEVPTVDELTTRERKKYAQGKSFTRRVKRTSGRGTVKMTISPDMVDEQTRIKTGKVPPLRADDRRNPDDERPASKDRNPKPSRKGIIAWLMRRLNGLGAGAVAGKLGVVGSLVSTILTGVEVEEELDRMLRVMNNELERQRSEGVSEEDLTWTEAMETQRMDTIDNITDLALNALVLALISAAAGAGIWALLGAVIGAGPVGWIAAIIGGGVIGFYGADGVAKILEWTGIKEDINNFIARVWLTESAILGLAAGVDVMQGSDPETGDISGDDPWFGGDTQPQQAEESLREANNETEVVNKIKKAIQQNPKLRQAFDKGKAFGQEVKQNLN